MTRLTPGLLLVACLLSAVALADDGPRIENGSQVSFSYTLTLADGTELESNVDTAPMTYTHGAGQIIPGLEHALTGHVAGDSFSVTIPPEQAYGAWIRIAYSRCRSKTFRKRRGSLAPR